MIYVMSLSSLRGVRGLHTEISLEPEDGDLTNVGVVDPENIDIGRKPIPKTYSMVSGRRVLTDNLPTKLSKKGGRGALADIEKAQTGRVVTDRFKDVVDDVCGEGSHQFEPVEIVNPSGGEDRHRWWFVPAVRLRALDPERTKPPLHEMGFFTDTRGAKREYPKLCV